MRKTRNDSQPADEFPATKHTENDLDRNQEVDESTAAIKIQAGFKGFMARKALKSREEAEQQSKSEDTEKDAAAVKIQAGIKGYIRRKNLKAPQENKQEDKGLEEEMAATKIKASFKGYQTRKSLKTKTGRDQDEGFVKAAASTKIDTNLQGGPKNVSHYQIFKKL